MHLESAKPFQICMCLKRGAAPSAPNHQGHPNLHLRGLLPFFHPHPHPHPQVAMCLCAHGLMSTLVTLWSYDLRWV